MSDMTIKKPAPRPSPVSQPFWTAAENHRLVLQHCLACERAVFYPRRRCPYCWSNELEWREASGRGVIASFIGVYKPGHPAFAGDAPYVVALVDLEEGPRMLSNIVDRGPDEDLIGLAVEVVFEDQAGTTLPKFRTSGGPA